MGAKQGGEQQQAENGNPDPECIFRRVAVLRPGITPGIHKLVKVAEDRAGEAIDIGFATPRAIIGHAEHVGRTLTGSEVQKPLESGDSETAALD